VLAAHTARGASERPVRSCTHAAITPEERPTSGADGTGGRGLASRS